MRRKLTYYLSMILMIVILGLAIIGSYLYRINSNQDIVNIFFQGTMELSEVFSLSVVAEQQIVEHRNELLKDINPLVDNIIRIDELLARSSLKISDADLENHCIRCHRNLPEHEWKDLENRIDDIVIDVGKYKRQLSRVLTTNKTEVKDFNELAALETIVSITTKSDHLKRSMNTMVGHLVAMNKQSLQTIIFTIGITILLTFMISYSVIVLLVKNMVTPLEMLTRATHSLGKGEMPAKVEVRSQDEIQILTNAFNRMVGDLQEINLERNELLATTKDLNVKLQKKAHDVSLELQVAQEHLVRTETLQAVGTLAAGVSHEISNPLGIIIGIVSLTIDQTPPETQLYEDLQNIEIEASRCQKIIEGLLDFARFKEIETTLTDINAVVTESVDLIRHQSQFKKIKIQTDLAAAIPRIVADPNRLKQVFINLFLNASKAMPNGGMLSVVTGESHENENNEIVIIVEDTGVGIPQENLQQIFDPFFTTGTGNTSTGLGLSITHRIIEQHGGKLNVESAPGKGATFFIRIPIASTSKIDG